MSGATYQNRKILIINPNSSAAMTSSLSQLIATFNLPATIQTCLWNPSSGPSSINNDADASTSCDCVLRELPAAAGINLAEFDAFLVACYSDHPLTRELASILAVDRKETTAILGIFEASVKSALTLLERRGDSNNEDTGGDATTLQKFGIVTTGVYWESALSSAVVDLISSYSGPRRKQGWTLDKFKCVVSTGLSAGELHSAPPEEVHARMVAATRRLVRDGDVSVVCLGCAGMAGMDKIVSGACVDELGEERGGKVRVVDGVAAGIGMLSKVTLGGAVAG
jgi:Asp/Glu/hydantoin racemase